VGTVVIGVDPHKASNTLVVIDERERVLAQDRFANDRAGYREMKLFARTYRDRVWAVEGARGVGAGLAQRLVAEGEPVLDVPAGLSARVRALGGGSGRKTDAADAFAVAVAASTPDSWSSSRASPRSATSAGSPAVTTSPATPAPPDRRVLRREQPPSAQPRRQASSRRSIEERNASKISSRCSRARSCSTSTPRIMPTGRCGHPVEAGAGHSCMVDQKDSMSALSTLEATLPIEPSRPASRSR
jgi:hypothetical protein